MREETLFHLALQQPPGERAPFLDRVCAGDAALRRPVEALLEAHAHPGSFLAMPAVDPVPTKGPARPRPASPRLAVEALEDRAVPTSLPPLAPGVDRLGILAQVPDHSVTAGVTEGGVATLVRTIKDTNPS
jgi:hypothetical protein